jgi:hypothetical protein
LNLTLDAGGQAERLPGFDAPFPLVTSHRSCGARQQQQASENRFETAELSLEPILLSGAEAPEIALWTTIDRRENHRFGASHIQWLKATLPGPSWDETDKKYWKRELRKASIHAG